VFSPLIQGLLTRDAWHDSARCIGLRGQPWIDTRVARNQPEMAAVQASRANLLRHAVRVAALLLLASCGGGGDIDPADNSGGRAKPLAAEAAAAFFPPTPIPADAATRGMWSPVYDWPLIAVHSVLLPDGRLLTYGTTTNGEQSGLASYDIWDATGAPNTGHLLLPNGTGTDLFCSSSVLLPPQSPSALGNVFIAGGDNWIGNQVNNTANPNSNVLDVQTGVLARQSDMKRARWYSTSTTLINGETYIQGGSSGGDRPEIRGLDGVFRLLSSANTSTINDQYPRNFVAPDGRVFGFDSNGKMFYINTLAAGSVQMVGQLSANLAGWTGSAAMFSPGRILRLAGNSNAAAVIDITASLTVPKSSPHAMWVPLFAQPVSGTTQVFEPSSAVVDHEAFGLASKSSANRSTRVCPAEQ